MALYRYFFQWILFPAPVDRFRAHSPANISDVNKAVMDASKTQRSNSTPNITVYIIALIIASVVTSTAILLPENSISAVHLGVIVCIHAIRAW